jgi:hypothetical protein
MTKLERILMHIMLGARRGLGRTALVKLCYLIDVESMRLTGKTVTGLQFIRYHYGPYAVEATRTADKLLSSGLIGFRRGSYFSRLSQAEIDGTLTNEETYLIDEVMRRYGDLPLNCLKLVAYETPPMRRVTEEEKRLGTVLNGRPLDMSSVVTERKKRPLSAIVRAKGRVDFSSRGTIEEAAAEELRIFRETEPFRTRALECQSKNSSDPSCGRPGTISKGKST